MSLVQCISIEAFNFVNVYIGQCYCTCTAHLEFIVIQCSLGCIETVYLPLWTNYRSLL